MTPREELLKIQKTITENLKDDIQSYQSKPNLKFKRYTGHYKKEFKSYQGLTDKNTLLDKINKSDIVYLGDYHTLDQSQKTVIKILREIIFKRKNITIGIELVYHDHQKHIDDFMKGTISEKQFLNKIDYYINWGFYWKNYRPIFDFAKKNSIRIIALNCRADEKSFILEKRDTFAADLIAAETLKHPKNLLFVLYGDLHIASKHIPKKVSDIIKSSKVSRNQLMVYQNSEHLYWKLAEQGKENADVVRISSNKFCIMNTPPWIRLQTYLNWLEKSGEILLTQTGTWLDDSETSDYYHQIINLISAISGFFQFSNKGFDQFHLYTTAEVEFVDFMNQYMKNSGNLSLKDIELIRTAIIYDGICLCPEKNVLYISNPTVNKVSEKVAQMISFKMTKYFPRLKREGDRDYFYSRVLTETIGFIGSKVINFKRKCDRLPDYKKMINLTKKKRLKGRLRDEREIAKLIVNHCEFEKTLLKRKHLTRIRFTNKFYTQEPRIFMGFSKALGFMLGNRLFNAMMTGKIYKKYLRNLFLFFPKKDGDSFIKYVELLKGVKDIKEKYKSKTERF